MDSSPSVSKVIQIAMVVDDLDAAMQRYVDELGVGPWSVFLSDHIDQSIRERPASVTFRIGLCDALPIQLELVEPLDDVSIYAEFLRDHGPGLHHLAFETSDDDPIIHAPDGRRRPILCSGVAEGEDGSALEYFYFDTREDLGYYVETYRIPPTWTRPAPDRVYPSPVT